MFRRASRDAHQVRWFRHLRERRVIRRVFGTLRKYASRRGLILRIVRRLTRRLRTEAFLRWKDWVTGRTKVEAIVHQFILRRQHSMKQRVFAALSRSIHDVSSAPPPTHTRFHHPQSDGRWTDIIVRVGLSPQSKMEAMQAQMMSQLQTQQMSRMRAMLARVQKGSLSYTFTLWRDNTREIRRQRRVVAAFAFKMKHASVMRLFTLWRDNARCVMVPSMCTAVNESPVDAAHTSEIPYAAPPQVLPPCEGVGSASGCARVQRPTGGRVLAPASCDGVCDGGAEGRGGAQATCCCDDGGHVCFHLVTAGAGSAALPAAPVEDEGVLLLAHPCSCVCSHLCVLRLPTDGDRLSVAGRRTVCATSGSGWP